MPAFHVQIQGSPVECRTPLLRRCFAIHSALLSTTTDGKPDPAEFGAVWSAALGACLPESVGAPRARGLQTPADWVAYGDRVERWAFGRGGRATISSPGKPPARRRGRLWRRCSQFRTRWRKPPPLSTPRWRMAPTIDTARNRVHRRPVLVRNTRTGSTSRRVRDALRGGLGSAGHGPGHAPRAAPFCRPATATGIKLHGMVDPDVHALRPVR